MHTHTHSRTCTHVETEKETDGVGKGEEGDGVRHAKRTNILTYAVYIWHTPMLAR